LVLRYQKPVFKILGTLIFDRQTVEEIAQESFLRAYKSLPSFVAASGASFSTWLFTIARNLAFNELDKLKVRKTNAHFVTESEQLTTGGPDKDIESAETTVLVRNAVRKLPQEFRLAVVMSCLEGHSISEIADIEGCSEGTIKSRIFRGKQMLRGFLTPILGDDHGKLL
jgi:RNA polymerase sigma-70 factor (ECF subfamily)